MLTNAVLLDALYVQLIGRFHRPANPYLRHACETMRGIDRHLDDISRQRRGWVYFMRSYEPTENGRHLWKIGFSVDPISRKSSVASDRKCRIEIAHQVKSDAPRWLEAKLHVEFSPLRIEGEYFDLDTASGPLKDSMDRWFSTHEFSFNIEAERELCYMEVVRILGEIRADAWKYDLDQLPSLESLYTLAP